MPNAVFGTNVHDSVRSFLAEILPPPLQFMAESDTSALLLIAAALAALFLVMKMFEFAVAVFQGGKLINRLIRNPKETWRAATAETAKTHHLDLLRSEAAGRDAQTQQGIEDLKAQIACLQSLVETMAAQKQNPSALEQVNKQVGIVFHAAKAIALSSPSLALAELRRAAALVSSIDKEIGNRIYKDAKDLVSKATWFSAKPSQSDT